MAIAATITGVDSAIAPLTATSTFVAFSFATTPFTYTIVTATDTASATTARGAAATRFSTSSNAATAAATSTAIAASITSAAPRAATLCWPLATRPNPSQHPKRPLHLLICYTTPPSASASSPATKLLSKSPILTFLDPHLLPMAPPPSHDPQYLCPTTPPNSLLCLYIFQCQCPAVVNHALF